MHHDAGILCSLFTERDGRDLDLNQQRRILTVKIFIELSLTNLNDPSNIKHVYIRRLNHPA